MRRHNGGHDYFPLPISDEDEVFAPLGSRQKVHRISSAVRAGGGVGGCRRHDAGRSHKRKKIEPKCS